MLLELETVELLVLERRLVHHLFLLLGLLQLLGVAIGAAHGHPRIHRPAAVVQQRVPEISPITRVVEIVARWVDPGTEKALQPGAKRAS